MEQVKYKPFLSRKLYNVGDKVKIINIEELKQSLYRNDDGFMDQYAGTFMTIRGFSHGCYLMREDYFYQDGVGFFWQEELIEGKFEDYDYYI